MQRLNQSKYICTVGEPVLIDIKDAEGYFTGATQKVWTKVERSGTILPLSSEAEVSAYGQNNKGAFKILTRFPANKNTPIWIGDKEYNVVDSLPYLSSWKVIVNEDIANH